MALYKLWGPNPHLSVVTKSRGLNPILLKKYSQKNLFKLIALAQELSSWFNFQWSKRERSKRQKKKLQWKVKKTKLYEKSLEYSFPSFLYKKHKSTKFFPKAFKKSLNSLIPTKYPCHHRQSKPRTTNEGYLYHISECAWSSPRIFIGKCPDFRPFW